MYTLLIGRTASIKLLKVPASKKKLLIDGGYVRKDRCSRYPS